MFSKKGKSNKDGTIANYGTGDGDNVAPPTLSAEDIKLIQDELKSRSAKSIFMSAIGIILFQAFMILMYGIFVFDPENEYYSATTDLTSMYIRFNALTIMAILGFGLIHVKTKKNSLTTLGFSFILYIISFEWGFLTNLFWGAVYTNDFTYGGAATFTAYELYKCAYAGMTIVITYGLLSDNITFFQMIIVAFFETFFFSFIMEYVAPSMNLFDPGYTYLIHMVAAYFGVGVSLMNGVPFDKWRITTTLNPEICFFGTFFLYIYWPSFVGGTYTANSHQAQHSFINTIISMNASAISSFVFSPLFNKTGKFREEDLRSSTIAGGIVIGSVCIIPMSPFIVILIGTSAGLISILANRHLEKWLHNHLAIWDSNGIHSTHGIISVLGAILSVGVVGYVQHNNIDDDSVTSDNSAWAQGVMIPIVMLLGLFFGFITGIIAEVGNRIETRMVEGAQSVENHMKSYFNHNDFEILSNDYNYFDLSDFHSDPPLPSGYQKHSDTFNFIAKATEDLQATVEKGASSLSSNAISIGSTIGSAVTDLGSQAGELGSSSVKSVGGGIGSGFSTLLESIGSSKK